MDKHEQRLGFQFVKPKSKQLNNRNQIQQQNLLLPDELLATELKNDIAERLQFLSKMKSMNNTQYERQIDHEIEQKKHELRQVEQRIQNKSL